MGADTRRRAFPILVWSTVAVASLVIFVTAESLITDAFIAWAVAFTAIGVVGHSADYLLHRLRNRPRHADLADTETH